MGRIRVNCDWCGIEIERYPSGVKKHNFCCRSCLAAYSSRAMNPEGYLSLKRYEKISKHMTELNQELNPTRMNFQTRTKLRIARLGTGRKNTYTKTFGVHTHRVVAEQILGRKLLPGEVVHHIDGDKQNNKPENLRVFKCQADHARWHKENGGDAT